MQAGASRILHLQYACCCSSVTRSLSVKVDRRLVFMCVFINCADRYLLVANILHLIVVTDLCFGLMMWCLPHFI